MDTKRKAEPTFIDKKSLSGVEVPADCTGPTPEEVAYKPHIEARYLPRYTFPVIVLVLLTAFVVGGAWYYHSTVLPEKNYQTATNLFQRGEYEKALLLYKKVLKTRPERKDTLFQIGFILEKLNDISGAQAAYIAHLKNQPNDSAALIRLGTLYKKLGFFEKAIVPLQQAAKKQSKNAELFFDIASIYQKLDQKEQAAEYFQKAVALETKNTDRLILASKSLMTLGHYEEALTGYDKVTFISSADKRGAHGAYAAKRMLGLPVNEKELIIPEISAGIIHLGASSQDRQALLGSPLSATELNIGGEKYKVQTYAMPASSDITVLYIDAEDKTNQISSTALSLRTKEGLGVSNFDQSKYSRYFERWKETSEPSSTIIIYKLKTGGLSFRLDTAGKKPRTLFLHTSAFPLGIDADHWSLLKE